MSNLNFESLLNISMDTVEKPKPLPVGHYNFLIVSKDLGQSKEKKTPFVSYKVRALAPHDDVDQNDLAAVNNWNQKEMKLDFYLTADSMFRLKDFAEHCGVDATGKSVGQLIEDLMNATFAGQIGHSFGKDNETIYANIVSTMQAQ
jgi:hypothetical protein